MRARYLIGGGLLVLAFVLFLASAGVVGAGPPWGFRGHQAVVLESAGTVDVAASEERRVREQRESNAIPPTPGSFLDAGDEIRVGRYGELRMRLPAGDVVVRDGGHVILGGGASAEPPVRLMRGLVHVKAAAGAGALEVKADELGASLSLRAGPGEAAAEAAVLLDATGLSASIVAGSASVRSPTGEAQAAAGQVVTVGRDRAVRAAPRPATLALSGTCAGGRLDVRAPDGTQIFAAAGLHAIKDGALEVEVPDRAASIAVLARDVAGNVAQRDIPCGARSDGAFRPGRSDRPGRAR